MFKSFLHRENYLKKKNRELEIKVSNLVRQINQNQNEIYHIKKHDHQIAMQGLKTCGDTMEEQNNEGKGQGFTIEELTYLLFLVGSDRRENYFKIGEMQEKTRKAHAKDMPSDLDYLPESVQNKLIEMAKVQNK